MNTRPCGGPSLVLLVVALGVSGLAEARGGRPGANDDEWAVPARAARAPNPIQAGGAILERGRHIFTKECVSCHGLAGRGDGPKAGDLSVHPGDLSRRGVQGQSDGALFWKITRGRKPMPAYHSLSADDRWKLVHYIRTLDRGSAGAEIRPQDVLQTSPASVDPEAEAVQEPEKDVAVRGETVPYVSREEYESLRREHEQLKREIQTLKTVLEGAGKKGVPPSPIAEAGRMEEAAAAFDEDFEYLESSIDEIRGRAAGFSAGTTRHLLTGFAFASFASRHGGDSVFSAGFSPIFLWQLSERLLFEGELKLSLEPNQTDADLDRAQIYYRVNDYMTLGAGKFLSPMNFLEDRLHQVTKLPDNPLPIQALLPRRNVGLQLRGAIPVRAMKLDYAVYAANAPDIIVDDPAGLGRLQFDNSAGFDNRIAVGGRVGFFPIRQLQAGYGFQVSGVKSGAGDARALLHSVDLNYVRDARALKGTVNFLAQWAWSNVGSITFDPDGSLGFGPVAFDNRRDGGYVQVAYRPTMAANHVASRLEPILRYERLNQRKAPSGFGQQRWTAGLNYWILPSAVIKTAYQFDDRSDGGDQDALLLQFKIGF